MCDKHNGTHVRGGVQIERYDDYDQMSDAAAACIAERIDVTGDLLLCAATGDSPTGMYARLAAISAGAPNRFERLRIIKLDEWGGLPMDNPATCEAYIQQHVVAPLKIAHERYVAFESNAADPNNECERISDWLAAHGPIDVCVLGLGANGHLALNEPGDELQPFAHKAVLSERSKQHSMLDAAGAPVDFGLTLGIADILAARRIVFIVSGTHKRDLFAQFRTGPITTQFPASMLWLHPDVRCFCDRQAWPEQGQ